MGILSVAVNLGLFYLFLLLDMNYLASNLISYLIATLLFFLLSKFFVYGHDSDLSLIAIMREFLLFLTTRIGTTILENVLLVLCVDALELNVLLSKVGISLIVIVLNYLIASIYVFKRRKPGNDTQL